MIASNRFSELILIFVVIFTLFVVQIAQAYVVKSEHSVNGLSKIPEPSARTSVASYPIDSTVNELAGIFEGRRRRRGDGKHRRYSRLMYHIVCGLLISKFILFPLVLKVIAIMSSAAFLFSKISLMGTLMMGLKWFLTHNHTKAAESSKVEIIHVPMKKLNTEWDRETDNKYHLGGIHDGYDPYYDLKPTTYA